MKKKNNNYVKTKTQLEKVRKINSINENHKKFSYFPKGMHGFDIPQFSETNINDQKYWTHS